MAEMTDDELAEYGSKQWSDGRRSALIGLLRMACRDLGYDDPEARKASWLAEREEVVSILREVCGDFGDNDWEDDLHLRDVIDKHLAKHLHTR